MKYSELPKEVKLQDDVNSLLDTNEELRKRIDKAIEYIDRMTRAIDYDDDELITWEYIIDIEKILRGDAHIEQISTCVYEMPKK